MTITKKLLLLLTVSVLSNVHGSDDESSKSPNYSKDPLTEQEIQEAFHKLEEQAYQESAQRTLRWINKSIRRGLAEARARKNK